MGRSLSWTMEQNFNLTGIYLRKERLLTNSGVAKAIEHLFGRLKKKLNVI